MKSNKATIIIDEITKDKANNIIRNLYGFVVMPEETINHQNNILAVGFSSVLICEFFIPFKTYVQILCEYHKPSKLPKDTDSVRVIAKSVKKGDYIRWDGMILPGEY